MIQFFIDREPRFLHPITGQVFTQEDVNRIEHERIESDRKYGYNDRMNGYYDKWYRYNRSDEGKAYDEGVTLATKEQECSEEMYVIPCMI